LRNPVCELWLSGREGALPVYGLAECDTPRGYRAAPLGRGPLLTGWNGKPLLLRRGAPVPAPPEDELPYRLFFRGTEYRGMKVDANAWRDSGHEVAGSDGRAFLGFRGRRTDQRFTTAMRKSQQRPLLAASPARRKGKSAWGPIRAYPRVIGLPMERSYVPTGPREGHLHQGRAEMSTNQR